MKKVYLVTILLSFIWSIYIVLSKVAISHLPVYLVGLLSRAVTISVLLVLFFLDGQAGELKKLDTKFWHLVTAGIFNFLLNLSAFFGFRYSTAANASILLRTDILFTIILSRFLLKERLRLLDGVGITLMIAGSFMVMDIHLGRFQLHYLGDLLFVATALLIVINAFIIKIKLAEVQDRVVAFHINLVAALGFLICFLLGRDYRQMELLYQYPSLGIVLVLLGLSSTLVFLIYYYSLRRLPIWVVRILLLFTPIFSIILSRIFLGEMMKLVQFFGMGVVLLGALGIIYNGERNRV